MLIILSGNHTFLRQQALVELKQQLDLQPQIVSVDGMTPAQLTDLIAAQSLFEPQRFVLIYGLAENAPVWQRLEELAPSIAEDDSLTLVLLESKLDGRAKFTKTAKQNGWLREFVLDTDQYGNIKDYYGQKSIEFILEQAKELALKCDRRLAQYLYEHVGANPWELYLALERLQIMGEFSATIIDKYVPKNPLINVFEVLNKAFRGQRSAVKQEIDDLESTETEPRSFFGLLSSQIFNILAIATAPRGASVATDLSINPYVVRQLTPIAQLCSVEELKQVVGWFIEVDSKLKSGSYDAWLEIRVLLNQIIDLTSDKNRHSS